MDRYVRAAVGGSQNIQGFPGQAGRNLKCRGKRRVVNFEYRRVANGTF